MNRRLWYPQLDAYDAIRRMVALLAVWTITRPPSIERLYIADFYLANPPLLHKTHMSKSAREVFRNLAIVRPEKSFVSFPSAPILFQRMAEVQREALRTLVGKELVEASRIDVGVVTMSKAGLHLYEDWSSHLYAEDELVLAEFVANTFVSAIDEDILALRRNTGLRRVM